jgi:CDP-glucose 4,6-dehydratase
MGALVNIEELKFFKDKRVFVTGHTGFKGSWLTMLLKLAGAHVMGFALRPSYSDSHFERLSLESKITNVFGDIRDCDLISKAMSEFQPEIVFHLAAQALVKASYQDPVSTYATNVMGGVHLLEAIRNCSSVRAAVFITSDKCYENVEWVWGYRETDMLGGIDPYSASKASAEIICSSYTRSFFADRKFLAVASARAGNVIGGGDWAADRLVPDCIRALQRNEPIVIRNPLATRPWQHVLEPLSGYLCLAERLYCEGQKYSGAWNFGPGVGDVRTVHEVAKTIASAFPDGRVELRELPNQPHEATLLQLNSDKALQLLNWRTRWSINETVTATIDWYRNVLMANKAATEITRQQIENYFGAHW